MLLIFMHFVVLVRTDISYKKYNKMTYRLFYKIKQVWTKGKAYTLKFPIPPTPPHCLGLVWFYCTSTIIGY